MRTKIFSEWDLKLEEQFQKDFRAMLELPDQVLGESVQIAEEARFKPTNEQTKDFIAARAKELGRSFVELRPATDVVNHFLTVMSPRGKGEFDRPESLAADLEELGLATASDRERLVSFLQHVRAAADRIGRRRLYQSFADATLPTISSISHVVDLRGVFKERRQLGTDTAEYEPNCVGVVPIVALALHFDEGDPVFFQVREEVVGILERELQAIRKELRATTRFLKLSEPGSNE